MDRFDRIPYRLYHDRAIYERELERIFMGDTWSFLGFEAEIPRPGDFRTSVVGETPVIVDRATDGHVHAFVNRCSHRGALVRLEGYGNAAAHACLYHHWEYDLTGALTAVPFEKGIMGESGMPPAFDRARHGLTALKVASVAGVLFGTFSKTVEPIEDYLGPTLLAHLKRTFNRPLKILGYQRQLFAGNWKMYPENVRDHYHGGLLHGFQRAFAINRTSHAAVSRMDATFRHGILAVETPLEELDRAPAEAEPDRPLRPLAAALGSGGALELQDPRLLEFVPEFPDHYSTAIASIFPNCTIQQLRNALGGRQIRPKGPDAFELVYTLVGFADESEAMTRHRLRQANLVGPAGFVSLEDGEALRACQEGHARTDAASLVQMGGTGPIADSDVRLDDVMLRGFWSYYARVMDLDAREFTR